MPSSTSLRVTLSLSAHVDEKLAGQRLAIMLADLHLGIDVTVDATNEKVSLFEVDSWLDDINDRTVHLLVALQLRNAISNLLEKRMAEAAVALLAGHPSLAAVLTDGSSVRVHRPERGPRETPDEILASAARWGQSAMSEIDTAWTCDVSPNSYLSIRSSKHFDPRTGLCDLNATIGDCGYANQWLTLALAARQSTDSGFPQSVIVQEGEELIALTCKKHT